MESNWLFYFNLIILSLNCLDWLEPKLNSLRIINFLIWINVKLGIIMKELIIDLVICFNLIHLNLWNNNNTTLVWVVRVNFDCFSNKKAEKQWFISKWVNKMNKTKQNQFNDCFLVKIIKLITISTGRIKPLRCCSCIQCKIS